MGTEPKTTSDHSPSPSPSPTVTELISELKTCFSSIDFQNVAKILTNREQDLLNKTLFLENEKDEILKENKKLNALLKKQDAMIETLVKENDGLKNKQSERVFEKDEILKEKDVKIENLEKENDRLKIEVKNKQNDLGVRVLDLEKLSKELMGSESFSEAKKAKKVAAESSRPLPPPGFEEITDPKPKKDKESKHPVIIEIDDDDDDDEDDHGDRDLMKMSSLKRRRVSDEIEIEDSDDDDKYISVLKRKKVSEKVKKDHKNAKYDDKIPMRTQPTSHSKSPFCDSSGSDSDDEKAKFSAKLDLPKGRFGSNL